MWATPLDLKEWELDLNVHISLKLGRVLHKSCRASRQESLKGGRQLQVHWSYMLNVTILP